MIWPTRAASQVALDDPGSIAQLLHELRAAGAEEAAATLLARHPADDVGLDNPLGTSHPLDVSNAWNIASLLQELRVTGAEKAASDLATRAANHVVRRNHPWDLIRLLHALHSGGADEAITDLLAIQSRQPRCP